MTRHPVEQLNSRQYKYKYCTSKTVRLMVQAPPDSTSYWQYPTYASSYRDVGLAVLYDIYYGKYYGKLIEMREEGTIITTVVQ